MKKGDDKDYEEFVAAGTHRGSAPVASQIPQTNAFQRIRKDLVGSKWRLAALYLGLTLAGYGVSLSLCAQNGVGILPFSYRVAGSMHFIPWPWCPLVCGALFTAVPNLFSRVFFTHFQQRYLIKRLGWLVAIAPLVASISLVLVGERDPILFFDGLMRADFSANEWLILWSAGAFTAVALLEASAGLILFRIKVS